MTQIDHEKNTCLLYKNWNSKKVTTALLIFSQEHEGAHWVTHIFHNCAHIQERPQNKF